MRCHNCHTESPQMFCSIDCAAERYSMVMEAETHLEEMLQELIVKMNRLLNLL